MRRRIGSTIYRARIFFNPEAQETLDDKVLRLLKNDLRTEASHGKIEALQADLLPERGSS